MLFAIAQIHLNQNEIVNSNLELIISIVPEAQ